METAYDKQLLSVIRRLIISLRVFQTESKFCEDLTFTQYSILSYVARTGSLEMSALHTLLSVEKSTTTRLVDPLVKMGYLKKTQSAHDSRAVELHLTGRGKAVFKNVQDCISDFMVDMGNSIPENKREDVIQSLEIFIRSMDRCCNPGECCKKQ
jgi:DNA-binding MarR family transcriptional regulator